MSHHGRLKRKEEELERYRLIVESLPDGVFTFDLKGNVTSVNDVVLSYGYKKEEVVGKSLLEFIPEKYWTMISKHLADLAEGKSTQGKAELRTKKGTVMTEFRSSPTKKRGEIIGFQSIVRDITQQKLIEEELRGSEEKYRLMFENSPDGIITLDHVGNITSVNDVVLSYGYKREELVGKNFLEFVPSVSERQRPILDKHVASVTSGKIAQGEMEFSTPKGRRTMWFRASPMKKREEIVGFQIILIDITKRKEMEEELRESEERLRNLYESVPDALAVYVGREGHLIEYNKAFKKWLGYTNEELKDKTFLSSVHPDYHAMLIEKYRTEYSEEDFPLVYEIKAVNKKGEIRPFEISVGPYKKKGRIIGIEVMHRDITERKEMEKKLQEYAEHLEDMVEERTRELRESQERLLKAERLAAIGQLATMVGHDLRNPLTSIQNASYYLKMKLATPKDEKVKKMFEVIDNEINYANNIVKDLLAFSRVKKPELRKVDIISSIRDALTQLQFPENIKVIAKFGKVPAIEADLDQLRRIFQNIALNGVQAMPNGGKLTVSARKNGDFVEVTFTDIGVGIPEENMQKLFTPLFTTKAQGVGLGLAICKNLVESHNGRIEARSKVGEGSTFTVKLPINQNKGGEKQT